MEKYLLISVIILLIIAIVLIVVNRPREGRALEQRLDIMAKDSREQLSGISYQMQGLTEKNYEQQIRLMETLGINSERQTRAVTEAVQQLQLSNEKKLEEMRKTVDEKLDETLNSRLNSSFKTVSAQLQNVYRSLGEMKELSSGVTENVKGLNRVLTNVKSRGTWAEVQLGNLLDEIIPSGYETNVRTNPAYNGQVEFAIKIPSPDGSITYLPLDSKFPLEDYARICAASEAGDSATVEAAQKQLELRIKEEARKIRQYISPPETTPFAIMYLATEGLYARVMGSDSALAEQLQKMGIMVSGPATLAALLNSLSMGFRSVAINQKAAEVFRLLGAAKAQYEKFGEQLTLVRKRLDAAGQALDDADKRNEIIQKRLRDIEITDVTALP